MNEHLPNEIRRLYRDYYAGRLTFADYRYRRGLLLDSLTIDIEDEMVTQTRPAGQDAPVVPVMPEPQPPAQKPPRRIFTGANVLVACIAVIALVVFFVTRSIDEVVPASAPVTSTPDPRLAPLLQTMPSVVETEVVRSTDAGQELVEDFVERQDWRQLSLLEFQDAWSRIASADRAFAKGTLWFEPLAEGVRYQISEASEFAATPEDDAQLTQLYEFSLQLGLVELVPAGWTPNPETINRGADEIISPDAPPVADVVILQESVVETEDVPQTPDSVDDNASDGTAATVNAANENACNKAQLTTRRRNCFDFVAENQKGPLLRVLAGGDFVMGNDDNPDDQPARSVSLANPYAISVFEITRADYILYCEQAGTGCPGEPWPGEELPVVDVNWHEAVAYCAWLTEKTGHIYRLPTEEEWEHAARGGTTTVYPFGDQLGATQARFSSVNQYEFPLSTSDRTTQRNDFGLWHVVGNVQEWVSADWMSDSAASAGDDLKVVRGGSYASGEEELRSTSRRSMPALSKDSRTGFRVVREL